MDDVALMVKSLCLRLNLRVVDSLAVVLALQLIATSRLLPGVLRHQV